MGSIAVCGRKMRFCWKQPNKSRNHGAHTAYAYQFIFITYRNQTHTACTSNCMSIRPYFFCCFIFIVLSFLILHSLFQNILLLFKSVLQVFWFYFCVFFSFFRECYFHNFFVLSIVLSLFRLFGRFHLFVGKCALYEPLSHSLPKTHSHGNVYFSCACGCGYASAFASLSALFAYMGCMRCMFKTAGFILKVNSYTQTYAHAHLHTPSALMYFNSYKNGCSCTLSHHTLLLLSLLFFFSSLFVALSMLFCLSLLLLVLMVMMLLL